LPASNNERRVQLPQLTNASSDSACESESISEMLIFPGKGIHIGKMRFYLEEEEGKETCVGE